MMRLAEWKLVRASAIVGALVAFAAFAGPLRAQSIALNAGAAPQLQVLPGATVAIPIEADLAGAGGINIASLTSGITWNTLSGGFAFTSLVVGGSGWPVFNATTGGSGSGIVSFATSNNANLPATSTLAVATFTATVGAVGVERGTRIFLAPTAAASLSGVSALSALRPRILDVCIAEGKWGDVNNDNAVNIIDAQQMARKGVGLSVANAATTTLRGDVTESGGEPDIIDAQQTARFSVLLSAAPRLGTGTFTTPAVATHNLSPSTPQSVPIGGTLQITNTPRTATSADLTGCAGSTWETSNAAIATVNASGLVTAVSGGTVTITSRSSVNTAITRTLSVTVTGGNPATKLFVATNPSGTVSGAAFATQPVVQVRDASNAVVTTATNQVTATLTSGTGTLLGTASVNAVSGIATFAGLRIDAAGAKTLTFSASGLTSGTTNFTVVAGALNSITVAINSPTVALNGSTTATANGFDAALNPVTVSSPVWSTNNFRIARVTAAGGVQGIGSGSANIVATSGAISGQSGLTVNAAPAEFSITMENVIALKPGVQAAFTAAAARWAQVIRGDLPDFTLNGQPVTACNGIPGSTFTGTVDDIRIYVKIDSIDGPGTILGSAGPCGVLGTRVVLGQMTFDSADVAGIEAGGQLSAVILHEMGHVLGIGTMWGAGALLTDAIPSASNDPIFTGTNGGWAFENLGTGYAGRVVPVENCIGISGCGQGTINAHWRELTLLRELMTGYVSGSGQPNPLSPLTSASLIDLGYVVDVNQSDNPPYFLRTYQGVPSAFELLGLIPILEGPTPPPMQLNPEGLVPARTGRR
jgi:hypothetical protein